MNGPPRAVASLAATGLLGWFLLSGLVSVRAAENSSWSMQVWKSDEGLPNNYVTGLAQTPDGFLWIATYSRPARFDGVHFEKFSPGEFAGLNDKIGALSLSKSGGLWMAMLHGPVVFLDSHRVQVFTNGLPNKVAQTLTEDGTGAVWITYQGGTICRLKDGIAKSFTVEDGWPAIRARDVASLATDSQGRLWFTRNGQLGIFRNERFATLAYLPDAPARLAHASDGGFWVGSGSELFKGDREGKLQSRGGFFSGRASVEPTVLLEDRQGAVWIGTAEDGLFRYDGNHFESVATSDRNISSLLEDQEGNLWVGTGSGGLNQIRPRVVRLETGEEGLPFPMIQSLCEDATGALWVTTQNGLLARRTTHGWTTISTNADWPGGRASCVFADTNGAVWIGTRDRALHCWRDGRFTSWRQPDGLIGREIHALWVSKGGDVWIGEESPDILQRLHAGRFETFVLPKSIRIIRAMTEDAAGNVWLGTSKGVLLRITAGGVVTDETANTTGEPLSIRCLYSTPDGSVWIGYADEGLGWWKNGRFVHVTSAQGLGDDTISQILADPEGWLWFGSDHGIFKVRQSEVAALGTDSAARLHGIHYGRSEGLFSLEANTGDSPGALRTRDNRLWIPMRSGLAVINPDKRRTNPREPGVVLKQVTVDGRVLASYGGAMGSQNGFDLDNRSTPLRLSPGHRRLEFEFTALTFTAPENVFFRYYLDGFDEDWIDAGKQRVVIYPRLPAGHYQFHVKACNGDGRWNETGATLAFTVAPFTWQTWWFRLLALVFSISATISAVRYVSFRRLRLRLQKLEQQAALERERSRIARDIHDDLGGRLTEVELLIEMARRAPEEQRPDKINRISSALRKAGESLDEIVWAVNPRHDRLPHLINYLGQYAIEFLRTAGIRCRVDFPEQPANEALLPEVRHNLFLCVKEVLNNIVRHAQATEIWFRISVSDGALNIRIEDNGRGFAEADRSLYSEGLRNLRQRMEEIGGEFQLDSRPGAGTRILLTLPWPPSTKAVNGNRNRVATT